MSAKSPSSSTDSSPNPKRVKTHKSPIHYTPLAKQEDIVNLGVLNGKQLQRVFGIDSHNRLRAMIEKGNNPQRQCKESIGEVELVDPKSESDKLLESGTTDSHHCWLCRFPLYTDEDIRGKPVQDTSIHCEHILPIMVGLVFTGIAGSKHSDPARSETRKNLEKMNYAWAHGPCNLLKSNMLLLKYGKSGIEFDEYMGTELAEKITNHVFKTDRGGIHSVLNTAYAEFATPTETNEQGKKVKPRKTRNSNKDSGTDPIEQKKSDYKDQLIEHYRSVIQYRAGIINQEIQQFNQGLGPNHAYNEYLSYVMEHLSTYELSKHVDPTRNMYDIMQTIVEVAKASSQKDEISKLDNKIKKLQEQLHPKRKRTIRHSPSHDETESITEIQEEINRLKYKIESIKSGMFQDYPPKLDFIVRSISREEDLVMGRNLSADFDDEEMMSPSKSGGRKHKSIKKRRRQKTNRHKSRKH